MKQKTESRLAFDHTIQPFLPLYVITLGKTSKTLKFVRKSDTLNWSYEAVDNIASDNIKWFLPSDKSFLNLSLTMWTHSYIHFRVSVETSFSDYESFSGIKSYIWLSDFDQILGRVFFLPPTKNINIRDTGSPCCSLFWYSRFWLFADAKSSNNERKLLSLTKITLIEA